MASENDIASDRALRYGRNTLFLSAVVIVAYVFQLDLSGASVLGIKPMKESFVSGEQIIWLVLLTVLIWQTFYFSVLVKEDYLIWKNRIEQNNDGLPISLYKIPAKHLPEEIINDEWVKQDHPTNYQWKKLNGNKEFKNIYKENHRQNYSAYRTFRLDRDIPMWLCAFAVAFCCLSLLGISVGDILLFLCELPQLEERGYK